MSEQWGNTIAIVVEGILRNPNDSSPIMNGVLLYHSLVKSHRVTLIFDSSNRIKVHHWLIMNGLHEHIGEIYWEPEDSNDVVQRREAQIARLRQQGPLSMLMESNPSVAEKMIYNGVPTMLYLHPAYMRPEHRPDYQEEITPWESLLSEVRREKEMRAMDIRLNDDF